MSLSFNSDGCLHDDVELSIEEFIHYYGTNEPRLEKIKIAQKFFKTMSECGCSTVYVGGSFVCRKKYPGDIDICFDLTEVNYDLLYEKFPGFFDVNVIGKIRSHCHCHILHCSPGNMRLLYALEVDRIGFRKGVIKINIKNFKYECHSE